MTVLFCLSGPGGDVDGPVGPFADFEAGHLQAAMEIQPVVLGKAVLQIFDGNLHVISKYRYLLHLFRNFEELTTRYYDCLPRIIGKTV